MHIASLLPGKASDRGRTGLNNRLVVSGCSSVLRSGAHWCDLPERYGKWKTVHRRFGRWCHAGVWERVFDALTADRDNQYLMIGSTIVRAHQQAATGKGGRAIHILAMRSAGQSPVSSFSPPPWVIGGDPGRYRPPMPATVVEKFALVVPLAILFAQHRVGLPLLGFAAIDLVLGIGFVAAYRMTPRA